MQIISTLVSKQREFFHYQPTKDITFRIKALRKLKSVIISSQQALITALKTDLNKSELDAYTTEIAFVIQEIDFILKNLRKWAKPTKQKTAITHIGTKSFIYPEPYGVVLIIAPWNYPFQLAIAPLLGAIAAGNCAIIKPSELTPNTSKVIANLINNNFPSEYLYVAEGDAEVSQQLLQQKFDYIFFTGSSTVGKIVMQAAANNLTPVTLELGGKSPCIVHHDIDLNLAAKRIVWGKFLNSGQTCIAPDYLLVHSSVKEQLLQHMLYYIEQFYGKNPLENDNITKIVSENHFDRLRKLIEANHEHIHHGGTYNEAIHRIEPTILTNISWDNIIMEEEIFGPVLPIITYDDVDTEMIKPIIERSKPLALYLFSGSQKLHHYVLQRVSFGGGCINDTIYHVATPHLPFGGVGASGMGSYHGYFSFQTFSHQKSIVSQSIIFDLPVRYPNYKNGLKIIKYLIRRNL